MQKKTRISFLIVNYHSADALVQCLADLGRVCDLSAHEVHIANNSEEKLIFSEDYIHVHRMPSNLGFGAAHNNITHYATGDILFFLNPDTYGFSENFCDIVGALEDEYIGLVAPTLLTEENKREAWSVGTHITPWQLLLNNCGIHRRLWEAQRSVHVAWVSAAACAVRKKVFQEVGGFDERFFLYYEDVDLCRRVRDHGHTVLYDPRYSTHHRGGASMDTPATQKTQFYSSQAHYIEKYYGHIMGTLWRVLQRFTHHI